MRRYQEGDHCPTCSDELVSRPAFRYPVITQALFGMSFLSFLYFMSPRHPGEAPVLMDQVKTNHLLLWAWTGAQILLGVVLIVLRIRARQRVLRCIRCGVTLG